MGQQKILPTFSGSYADYPEFREAFHTLVDPAGFGGGHKLALLHSCLDGNPKKLISGLRPIDRNYATALQILDRHYNRPTLIRQALLAKLRKLKPCENGRTLRNVYIELSSLAHQLCSEPDEELVNREVLVHLMKSKLPVNLQCRLTRENERREIGVFDVLDAAADACDEETIEQMLRDEQTTRRQPPPPVEEEERRQERSPKKNAFKHGKEPVCKLCKGQEDPTTRGDAFCSRDCA